MTEAAHRASVRLSYDSAAEAERMAASIAPENESFLETRVEGATLVLEAQAESPTGLLRTLDDALACLGAAERAGRIAAPE